METTEIKTTSMPRIGDIAPDFEAVTTMGKLNYPSLQQINGWSYFRIRQILHRSAPRR